MLVGGGVIDRVGLPGGDDLGHPPLVADRSEQRHDPDWLAAGTGGQVAVDVVEPELADLDQQQQGGLERQQLAAELAADRSAGARHHHGLARDRAAHQCAIGQHRFTAEQILDLDIADLGHVDPTVGDVHQPRKGADPRTGAARPCDDGLAPLLRDRWEREQYLLRGQAPDRGGDVGGRIDAASVEHAADQRGVVVEEADHRHLAALRDHRRQLAAGRAGAVDQHAPARHAAQGLGAEQPVARQDARSRDGDEQQDRLDQRDCARDAGEGDIGA